MQFLLSFLPLVPRYKKESSKEKISGSLIIHFVIVFTDKKKPSYVWLFFVLFLHAVIKYVCIAMEKIQLKDAIAIINKGEWLSLRVITGDVKTGKGGTVIDFLKIRIAKDRSLIKNKVRISADSRGRKNPHHSANFTLNMELENRLIRKIHPPLITHINGKEVI